ncbi:hypothetical protein [Lonepinella koalarum]|uniref:Uncharacterized protein n=1 Tax=Lonepinella koalarum TaxID=53417 RepID=A0A4R1KXH7_9PAST|nr:hypothetical protein [Lonepinella koalarum]MDH2927884.1 hypothetical protein [Lonepinella koalarum]TCK70078.1 hypothetical protein EV692_1304 [Lonepinella koalarum]TFJ90325.1 hypothetical protein E0709_03000 [Lonepinella koalarum]
MSYKWLNGYQTTLSEAISSSKKLLPILDAKELAQRLGEDHSYLVINDGTGAEIIKVISYGNQVKIERGQDNTKAKAFPAGSCIKWEVTKQGITETICNKEFECSDVVGCGCKD